MPLYNSDVYISIATPNIYWAHPRYSDFRQTNDQRSSRRNGNFFFRPIQREEVSSLVPAGFAVIHHPPLRACSCPQRRPQKPSLTRNKETRPSLRAPPWRGARGVPQSSALRLCRPPLRFALSTYRCALVSRVGDPPPLAPCYPALATWAFGM